MGYNTKYNNEVGDERTFQYPFIVCFTFHIDYQLINNQSVAIIFLFGDMKVVFGKCE